MCIFIKRYAAYVDILGSLFLLSRVFSLKLTLKFFLTIANYFLINVSVLSYALQLPVYVLLSEFYALVDFARVMQEKNLVDTGDHIVIAVEKDEVYDPSKHLQYCRTNVDMSEVSGTELRACRSVLMLTPSAPTSENWSNFKSEVFARGKKQPFNIPEHPYIKIDVSRSFYCF